MAVNKEHIKLWVDDLRTTMVNQGKEYLERIDPDGTVYNCCLGRACRVAMNHGVNVEIDQRDLKDHSGMDGIYLGFDSTSTLLPDSVAEFYGIHGDPKLAMPDKYVLHSTAVACNDELDYNFQQIADLIENTYLKESK